MTEKVVLNVNDAPFNRSAVLGALLLGTASLPSAALAAAPQTVAEVAVYKAADRQAVLEAGAKKEGQILVYTTGTQTQTIMDAFAKKYPFVRLEIYRAGVTDATRRMLEENKAGRNIADVLDLTTGGLRLMRDADALQPYYSPEMEMTRPEAMEPNKHWVFDYESYLSLGYNTKAISDKDAPQTMDDLLDPKWKGKMAVSGRSTTFASWVAVAMLEKGEEYVKKFAQQNVTVYAASGRGVANLVVSGEIALSPAIYSSHMANSKAKGANVGWRAIGPVQANIGAAALAKKAPHPHAAMLFIDFNLSKEGQILRQELGYASARTDLPSADKPSKIHYLTERPDYANEIEAWQSVVRKYFARPTTAPAGAEGGDE